MDPTGPIELIKEVAAVVGGELYLNYSGRGMYGAKCVGIVCANPQLAIEEALARGLRGSHQDHMGQDFIVDWPNLQQPSPAQEP